MSRTLFGRIAASLELLKLKFSAWHQAPKVVPAWGSHLWSELTDASGWKSFLTLVTIAFALVTLLQGLMTYQSSNLDHQIESAERSYAQLVSDLSSDSARMRIGAIHRIPDRMRDQVPYTSAISAWQTVPTMFGFKIRSSPKYRADMQFIVLNLFNEIRVGNSKDPTREILAMTQMLRDLGVAGWQEGLPSAGLRDISWIWRLGPRPEENDKALFHAFEGLPLKGISFAGSELPSGDFQGAELTDASYRGANLRLADFAGANGGNVHFEFARLDRANLKCARFVPAHFESTVLSGASLQNASLRDAHFENATMDLMQATGADFTSARFASAIVTNGELQSDDFDDADMSGATLDGSDLDFSRFEHAVLRGTRLRGASLRKADLDRADLSQADLFNADLSGADLRFANLSDVQNIMHLKSVRDANFFGVTGLSKQVVAQLIALGARSQSNAPFRPLQLAPACQFPDIASAPLKRSLFEKDDK